MTVYLYKAVRPSGEMLEGEMEAADEMELARILQQQGAIPVKVTRPGGLAAILRRAGRFRSDRLPPKQLALLTRELATLLEAGMTLDRSLQILTDLTPEGPIRELLGSLKESVRGGSTFAAALETEGRHFSRLYINMVKAGEAAGALQAVLSRLADYLESTEELKESVRSALVYPTILLTVSGLSVILLLMFVVPQFSQMFEDMGQTLPLPTQIVIALGDLLRGYWWVLFSCVLLLIAFIQSRLALPEVRYRWDKRLLATPLLGDLIAKIETARFSRTLSTLLANGLTLLAALNLVKDVISNRIIAEGVEEAALSLKRGKGFADPLAQNKVLPPLALQMIKVGEESGSLESMLTRVADTYDKEVRVTVKRMLTLLEPALIVGLGVIVAGIIVSILLAILKANQLVF